MLKTARLLAAAALAALLATAFGSSAQAMAHRDVPDDCPTDNVCFYPEPDYKGRVSLWDPINLPICSATPIIAKSVFNNAKEVYSVYDREGCEGQKTTLNPGTGGNAPANANFVSWW